MRQGHQRLLRLADMLERENKAPKYPYLFDMRSWGYKVSCGTSACAIGLALLTEEFNEEGLLNGARLIGDFLPVFKELNGYHAVAAFFEISLEEASQLFAIGCYMTRIGEKFIEPTEHMVAKRIRDLVVTQNKQEMDIRS